MNAPKDTVKRIIAESERLTQSLTTLPPDAWSTPSACERWEVRDVVAHLAIATEVYTDVIARRVQGDASPPAGRQWAGPTTAAACAADTAQRVRASREHLGDHGRAHFLITNAQLKPLLARLGPADGAHPPDTPLGSAPLRHIPADWLVELVVHGWDIRSRVASDAQLSLAVAAWPAAAAPPPLSCGAHGRRPHRVRHGRRRGSGPGGACGDGRGPRALAG